MSRNVRVAGSLHEEGENVGLHRFALFTACSTAFLIFVGGLVTSNRAGLSVPDWPTSYGWNMFTFPYSKWVGGIFYEHGHRLVASFVGFLTVILASWTWLKDTRRWIRVLSLVALISVITQGILGGLTVKYLLPTPISMTHALLAQTFFCMTIAMAYFTSPSWKRGLPNIQDTHVGISLPKLSLLTTGAVYLQLLLGAWMRHTESGLAIPDFPLAFGRLIPEFTNYHVTIHFAHRMGAILVAGMIAWTFVRMYVWHQHDNLLFRPALILVILVFAQLALGAFTIWTEKSPVITSVHVATGALILGTSFLLTLRAYSMVAREAKWQ
ncbi:MAG TPA: COX15/CtaA family protein [Terriglobia bacterium]|nr:COX15/CtaA family protein [Terriglobia bacterium]